MVEGFSLSPFFYFILINIVSDDTNYDHHHHHQHHRLDIIIVLILKLIVLVKTHIIICITTWRSPSSNKHQQPQNNRQRASTEENIKICALCMYIVPPRMYFSVSSNWGVSDWGTCSLLFPFVVLVSSITNNNSIIIEGLISRHQGSSVSSPYDRSCWFSWVLSFVLLQERSPMYQRNTYSAMSYIIDVQ